MRSRRPKDVRKWLEQQPPLSELCEAFPMEWASVRKELSDVIAQGDAQKFKAYVATISKKPVANKRGEQAQLSAEVRQQLTLAAVRRMCVSAATGVTSGRIRFNLLNGWIAQKLLFKKDLERKPASYFWFRVLWPLLWQRKFLMILVQPRGIYCFYSDKLLEKLASLIGDRSCLEIAAGDGTLSRFLRNEGVDIVATDDLSWSKTIKFPEDVIKQDARKALRTRSPRVVICSWPPAGNQFEREVFETPDVELYIVIASKHEFGTGNWHDYRSQTEFSLTEEVKLSKLVLPPEVEPAVYVFRRKEIE